VYDYSDADEAIFHQSMDFYTINNKKTKVCTRKLDTGHIKLFIPRKKIPVIINNDVACI